MQVNTKIDQYFIDALRLLSGKTISVLHPTPTTQEEFETNCRGLIDDAWVYGEAGLGVTFNQVKVKATELEETYNAQEYARNRSAEYPTMQEQLDMQYWDSINGTTTWQDAINAVKVKYPKPQ